MTDTYLFDAFGNLLSRTGTTENDFLYTGEQYDISTGFYYLRARYMNPSTGTFTSPDAYAGTIFDPVSLHKYLYANANPVMNRDPSGYSTFTLTEMEASIVISGIIGAAMNSIPKGIMRLVSGEPMDDMFWFTFASDFIVGFECGMAFAAIGFLATQFLLLSCLVKSILFTMGLKFSFDCIGDLWNGNYGSAILNAIGAAFCFLGASGFNYKGSGLGLGGFADDAANLADDAANLGDDAANLADEVANVADDVAGGAKTAPTNRGGLRQALLKLFGGEPPFEGAQAHHGLPWRFKDWFASKGINVNDPKYGAWVQGGGNGGHQSWSNAYDTLWDDFINKNYYTATAQDIEAFYSSIRSNPTWGGGF